jgi:hypothetical protein
LREELKEQRSQKCIKTERGQYENYRNRWNQDEIKSLIGAIDTYGHDWETIAREVFDERRNAGALKDKYHKMKKSQELNELAKHGKQY